MRRLPFLLAVSFLLLAAPPVAAAPSACRTWKKQQKLIDKQEKAYWDGYRARLDAMYASWRSQWSLWAGDPDTYKDQVEDLAVLRELYAEYESLQDARARVDLALASSGVEEASEELLDALFDVLEEAADLEQELAESRPTLLRNYYDQEPAIRRNGLATRVQGLVVAVAACPDAVSFLGGVGLSRAKRADKRRSVANRVAVIDALGATRSDAVRPVLESLLTAPEPAVRIAAVEHLAPFGADAVPTLAPHLDDPATAVRRALLEQIARDAHSTIAWIPPVMTAYEQQEGLVRARALEALVALTGCAETGDDEAAWHAWFETNRSGIVNGTWVRPEAEPVPEGEAPPAPESVVPTPRTTFYGVGAPSDHVVFVLDGTSDLKLPAELARQKEKARRTWLRTTTRWRDLYVDHHAVMLEQLEDSLEAAPESARFAVIYLTGGNPERVPVYGERKPIEPSKGATRKLLQAIAKPDPHGTISAEEGLRRALALCGSSPCSDPQARDECLDTVFLLHTGWVGGRWGIPEALVDEFRRRNRFHRLQVNAIRIADRKDEAAALMQGLASASGGTYRWLESLP